MLYLIHYLDIASLLGG